ncbi:MAG: adenosine deaminase [Leptospira sp.]|nr:adenosine deaminase [Leptospira sp.]
MNTSPRWSIFTESFEKFYGKKFDTGKFFENYAKPENFRKLYHFNHRGPFSEFQCKFNLIIALSVFDEKEIKKICLDVMTEQLEKKVTFAEYRIMYSPGEDKDGYFRKTLAACEGLREAESVLKNEIQGKLVLSLHRNNFQEPYRWVKEFMQKEEIIQKYLTGIDFCHIEEGFPPSDKKEFFQKVLADNVSNPESALSILYHVGESFQDKSPKSAVRWVIESAISGAHRLGHCLSLGLNPELFRLNSGIELVKERLDQVQFEIDHYELLRTTGETQELDSLRSEFDSLSQREINSQIKIAINARYLLQLKTFQDFAMAKIKEKGTVIETCPSSNLFIGMIENLKDHPLKRFLDSNLNVTIGSDDPGIFDTNLKKEYELAGEMGISLSKLDRIREKSFEYKSEILSGRQTSKNHPSG